MVLLSKFDFNVVCTTFWYATIQQAECNYNFGIFSNLGLVSMVICNLGLLSIVYTTYTTLTILISYCLHCILHVLVDISHGNSVTYSFLCFSCVLCLVWWFYLKDLASIRAVKFLGSPVVMKFWYFSPHDANNAVLSQRSVVE